MYKPVTVSSNREDRESKLQEEWQKDVMPCDKCKLIDICKYKDAIKRVDYPKHVFDIKVSCKLQLKYY